jgi:hypothetical protein
VTLRTPDHRADELNALLKDLDAAVTARFDKPQGVRRARQAESAPDGTGLRGIVAAALRWFRRSPTRQR